MKNISVRIICIIAITVLVVGSPAHMYAAFEREEEAVGAYGVLQTKEAANKYRQKLEAAKQESVAFASLLGDTPYPYAVDAHNEGKMATLVRRVAAYKRLHPEETRCATEDQKDAGYQQLSKAIWGYDAEKNAETLTALIVSGSPVNYEFESEDRHSKPLLKLAVQERGSYFVPLLLAAGVDITYRGEMVYRGGGKEQDVFTYAVREKADINTVIILLAAGAGIGEPVRYQNVLTEVVERCWDERSQRGPEAHALQCQKLAPMMRLLIMANFDTSKLEVQQMPEPLNGLFRDALKNKPIIEKEVDKQDWKPMDLKERQVLEILSMPVEFRDVVQDLIQSYAAVPDGVVSDVIEVARQRRLLAEKGVKINMQWAEKWAQKVEEESAAAAAAIKPRKSRKKEAGVMSQWLNKLASGWDVERDMMHGCF